MERDGETVVSKNDINIKKTLYNRDMNGKAFSTSEQFVPGERITYKVAHKCKYCGYTYYTTDTRDHDKT